MWVKICGNLYLVGPEFTEPGGRVTSRDSGDSSAEPDIGLVDCVYGFVAYEQG